MEKFLEGARHLKSWLEYPNLLQVKFLPEVFLSKQCEELRDDALVLMRLYVYISDYLIIVEQVLRISHLHLECVIRDIKFEDLANPIDNMLDSTIGMDFQYNTFFTFYAEKQYLQVDNVHIRTKRPHIGQSMIDESLLSLEPIYSLHTV